MPNSLRLKPAGKALELKRPHFLNNSSSEKSTPVELHPLASDLDIERRLEWITVLSEKHGLTSGDFGKIAAESATKILERQRESRLFVGVIGEFSSGKSSLINALIRKQLLKTDVLQGTTAAVTVLQHGEHFLVDIIRKQRGVLKELWHGVQGLTKSFATIFSSDNKPTTEDQLIDALHEATTNEELAKDIMQVNVTIPTYSLREGLVIVDTPGANAQNPRHGEITASAIKDLCDAALVVIPAEMAGSLSLINYLKENAGDLIHRCVFLVNKIDHLRRRKDQERILEFVRNKIREEFGIQNPRILAAAPQFVVASLGPTSDGRSSNDDEVFSDLEIEHWVGEFEAMESKLRECLVDKRLQAQVDDISLLLEGLYKTLGSNLEVMAKDYEDQHNALQQLVIPDIDGFIAGKANKHAENASSLIGRHIRGFDGKLIDRGTSVVGAVRYAIVNAKNKKELRQAVESTVPRIIRGGERRFVSMVRNLSKDVMKISQREFKDFHAEFQEHFRSLASLGGRINLDKGIQERSVANSNASKQMQTITSQLSTGLQSIQNADTTKLVGGGAAGAVAGTLILPGLGTIIGGLAGSLLSTLFGPSLDELKSACLNDIVPPLATSLDSLIDNAVDDVNDFCSEAIQSLGDLIVEYGPTYSGLVQTMRERDESEKIRLAAVKEQIIADQLMIQKQTASLDVVREKIRQI